MSRPGSTLTPSYGSSGSTGSQRGSPHSMLSGFEVITNRYDGDTGFGMSEGRYPISESNLPPNAGRYPTSESNLPPNVGRYPTSESNLPPNVKLPPNYKPPSHQTRTAPQPGMVQGVISSTYYPGPQPTTIPVSDIAKQLDFAATENLRLRERLQANNEILDRKLHEIEESLSKSNKEREDLKKQASEATNQFFEARVAVLGYKCNVLQLQGEVASLRKPGGAPSQTPSQPAATSAQYPSQPAAISAQYQQQVDALQREKQDLLRQLKAGGVNPAVMKDFQKQLYSLRSEKTAVDNERQNLMGVITELLRDIQSLQDKRALDQDELSRLSLSNQHMQVEIHELREAVAYQQQSLASTGELSLENETLRRQLQQLQQQLGVARQEKSGFEKKVAELQQRSEMLDRKLKEKPTGPVTPPSTPPIPKPRTNIQGYTALIERLQAENQKLESEKQQMSAQLSSLQDQMQREQSSRTMAESLLNTANTKAQKLSQELFQLEKVQGTPPGSSAADQESEIVAGLQQEISSLQQQVQQYQHDRTMAESELEHANILVGNLQRKCVELEREKADTPRELAAQPQREKDVSRQEAEREKLVSGQKWSEVQLQRRLSDALGEIDTMKKERSRLQQTETHRDELQAAVDQKEREIAGMRVDHPKELDRYRQELSQMQHDIGRLQQEVESANQMHTQAVAELERVDSESRQKQNSISQLKNEVEVRANERQSAQNRCGQLETQIAQLQTRSEDLVSAHQQVQTQRTELQTQVRDLHTEVEDAQQALDGYKQECAQTLQDYRDCAQELCAVREERDRQKKQADIGLRELTKRADRIKLLERQRNELQERLQHMEFQLKTYNSDFETERKSREDIVKTRVHAEQKIQEQARDIASLQTQLNSLSQQLTQQRLRGDENQFGVNQLDDPPGQLYQAPSAVGGHRQLERERELLSSQRRSGDQGIPPFHFQPQPPPPPLPQPPPQPQLPQVGVQDLQFGGGQRSDELRRLTQEPIRARIQDPIPRARVDMREPIPRAQIPPPVQNWTPSPPTHDQLLRSASHGAEMHRDDRRLPFTDVVPTSAMQPMPTGMPHDIGQLRPTVGAIGRNNLDLGTVTAPQGVPGVRYKAPGEIIDENPPAMACPLCGKCDFKTQTDLELHSAQCTDGTL